MASLRTAFCIGIALAFAFLLTGASLRAQTASTSTVTGTVLDKTGATVPNAKVALEDVGTKETLVTTTGNDGGYTFPSVRPGNYNVTVSGKGFRQTVISGVKVEVGRSALVNAVLEVGGMTETVEVTAGTGVELQTLDASVGDVLDANMLANMPSLSRDATALMLLQPTAIPGFNGAPGTTYGEGNSNGGTMAGARMDQNTFLIDGGDATSNMEGGGGYNSGFVATPRAVIPTPVESLEEFRVQTNNQGTDFTRSIGAEVQMVTIRGTNLWHGAGYWYHQNDEVNANDWYRARRVTPANPNGTPNPEWRDNRAGGKIGGPIWKNRTFFFVHEEERHFSTQATFQRLVPTAALRTGILKFKDAGGTIRAYNLNPSPTVDVSAGPSDNDPRIGQMIPTTGIESNTALANSGGACDVGSTPTCNPLDPRNIGLSSAIAAEWGTLPAGNDFTGGDGLRTVNFTSTASNIWNEHFGVVRLDHKISDKWDFMGSYRYSTSAIIPGNKQEDIGGIAPGCQKGVPCTLASRPLQPRYLVAGLTGRLTPNLVNEFHFDWLRHWWSWIAPGAKIPVIPTSLSDTRLQIWSESRTNGMVPINVDTQNARQRVWNGQDFTFSDNLSWIKGKHILSFGGRAQRQNLYHIRDDKVVGGITTPIYYVVRGGQFVDTHGIPLPTCATPGTGCFDIQGNDASTFRRAYTTVLGMVDQATQVLTRDANLNPNPAGTLITQREIVDAYELYFGDTWHLKPSFTFTWGLTWGVQLPPYDPNGKTTMMIDTSSGQIIDGNSLLNARSFAGANGNVVNPTVGYVPIKATGRKYPYDPDYSNFGPRLAAAWNPSFTDGILGKLFGNQKTVFRGGWSRAFERKNGVGLVLTPALGLGFGDLSACIAPTIAGVCGGDGHPNDTFRIGVDGNHVNIPTLPVVSGGVIIPGTAATNPIGAIVPGANSGFEPKDDRLDPKLKVGSSDAIDFSIQRELPGKMILEVGYIFRKARDLYGNIDLNSVPYMFKPKGTNQTFALAFDAVAAQLHAGVLPLNADGTANPAFQTQPALEAMFGGLTSPICSGAASAWGKGGAAQQAGLVGSFGSCTQAVAMYDQVNGNPFWPAHGAGALFTLVEPFLATGPWLASNTQVGSYDWTMSNTFSNYNAGFVTLRSRAYHGLTFDANYTLSHSLDNQGLTQECTGIIPDAYFPRRSYAPSLFDRRHTFNLLVNYELPLGKGKSIATGAFADRLLGGWSVSGIYTVASGLPDMVYDSSACFTEYGAQAANGNDTGLIPINGGVITQTRNNNPTLSSSGYGANSKGGVPNAFQNPDAVIAKFRYSTFADSTLGFGAIRGPRRWKVDLALAKTTRITERVSTRFDAQFVNAFNHPEVLGLGGDSYFASQPGMDISTPKPFGVPSNQFNQPRYIQFGLRFDF